MLKVVLIAIPVVVVVLLLIIAMRPADFHMLRSADITGSPGSVFAQVNDLHNWQAWSPWAKLDPNAKTTYCGPIAGEGAAFAWAGNMQIGEGRMTIIESRPNDLVRFKLEFVKPIKGTNIAEFTFKPHGDQTSVTWSMTGKNSFAAKAFGLFFNCDKLVGGQFEKGLADLNSVVANVAKK